MVLHKTTQHGSTFFFKNSAKMCIVLLIVELFLFYSRSAAIIIYI
jgi:hypothetical protein